MLCVLVLCACNRLREEGDVQSVSGGGGPFVPPVLRAVANACSVGARSTESGEEEAGRIYDLLAHVLSSFSALPPSLSFAVSASS